MANLRLNATQILKPALDVLKPVLGTVGSTPVGELLKVHRPSGQARRDDAQRRARQPARPGQRGPPGPRAHPDREEPRRPPAGLRPASGRHRRRHRQEHRYRRTKFISESIAKAGSIEVLPAFRGLGLPPLLKVTTGESGASVTYDRGKTTGVGSAKNTLVRIESELLPTLGLGQIGLAGLKPLETLTGTLGIKGGPGYIELAPGQNVTLFCDGALGVVGALCTEISVGMPKETKLPDGGIKVESAGVSIHLFKGLNSLVPGLNLGSILGNADLDTVLAPLSGATGLSLGEKTRRPRHQARPGPDRGPGRRHPGARPGRGAPAGRSG